MSSVPDSPKSIKSFQPRRPFRAAVLRGLAGFIPPLLTVVVVVWLFGTLQQYVVEPVEKGTRWVLKKTFADVVWVQRDTPGQGSKLRTDRGEFDVHSGDATSSWVEYIKVDGQRYFRTNDSRRAYVPEHVYATVLDADGQTYTSQYTADRLYERYVELKYLRWPYFFLAFLAIFILVLYFLGKLLAGRLGQLLWAQIERPIHRVPLVRNIYSSIKQVTDFLLNHQEFQFTRVVAVEYPRKNMWSIGFVTSESFADIQRVANEPILAVMIPASPMSVTGYTTTVLKSEAIELNITVDQALEFIVSCGVVIPPHQMWMLRGKGTPSQRSITVPPMGNDQRPKTKDQGPVTKEQGAMTKEE